MHGSIGIVVKSKQVHWNSELAVRGKPFFFFYQPSRCINNTAVPDTVSSPEFTEGASLKSTTTTAEPSHTYHFLPGSSAAP